MEQINNVINFLKNIQANQLIDILIALAVIIIFSIVSSILSYLFVKIFNLKDKSKKSIKLNPWYKAIKSILICTGLYLAILILNLPSDIKNIVIKALKIIVILVIAKSATNFFSPKSKIFTKLKESDKFSGDQTLVNFISKIIKTCIYIVAIFLVITEFGYDLSGLIAGLGLGRSNYCSCSTRYC